MKIPISKPYFTKCEKTNIIKPLKSGWVVQGPYVKKFENLFRNFTKSKYAHTTTSCTTALHLSLIALGIKSGDKVLIPSFTYIATANAIEQIGAEVVFCDINFKTFNIDENLIEDIIKKDSKIKAIIPVHLFGLCSNMPYIMKIAKRYNLKVIEDSACGFDAWIKDKHSGTFGDIGCFSFHPRKSLTTGEGGMIVTNSKSLNKKISQLKDYVKNYPDNIILNNPCLEYWFYLHYKIGGNFPNRCESVIDALKKQDTFFMNSKSPKYIEQVVKRLSDKIDIACENAKNRECNLEELKSCSSMYRIIEEFKL